MDPFTMVMWTLYGCLSVLAVTGTLYLLVALYNEIKKL